MAKNYLTDVDYGSGGDTFYEAVVTLDTNMETIDNEIYNARGGEANLDTRLDDMTIASGTKAIFYQDTAPTNWTIDATPNDGVVMVSNGSGNGGETGGAALSGGTWTQPNHTHEEGTFVAQIISGYGAQLAEIHMKIKSTANWSADAARGVGSSATPDSGIGVGAEVVGTSAGGATANTWRPKSYVCIICSKD